jgi:hypothetical protein
LFKTDWGFILLFIDASNDEDGAFPDGSTAFAVLSGSMIVIPVKTTDYLDFRVGHEMGHLFQAADEYHDISIYLGYLNVSSIPRSGCLMDTARSWNLSGYPHGLNGTWGQVGWRDSDSDGIQDIVDTPQRVYLNPYERIGNKANLTGVAAVIPTENKNPSVHSSKQNVTINKVQAIQFRIDEGEWLNANMTPTQVRKLVKYPDQYAMKDTTAIVNFTLLTPELSPGQHFIEVKATNQWGNAGYANATATIPEFLPTDLNKDGTVNILDISLVAKAYGAKPGDTTWNPVADLNEDAIINILDIAMVAKDYGKTV